MDTGVEQVREIPVKQIDVYTDTRDILARARQYAIKHKFEDVFIADIDSHHTETEHWHEIIKYISDPVLRSQADEYHKSRTGSPPYGLNGDFGLRYQDIGGRVPHQSARREKVEDTSVHRDVTLARRAYESLGLDYQIIFPTPMLFLGVHPQPEMEVYLGDAYNRWTVENVLKADDKLKIMAYLPFGDPDASLKTIEEFGDQPGVIGFMVTSVRYKPVHHNQYMKIYRALEERGLPIGFHAGYYWNDPSMLQINRFGSMHALSFVWCNVLHMTNWVMNGLPERFPGLKPIWIESGLSWVPWLMQRLDHQYMMRTSEAPLLKRRPSEYMREMFYTSQPLELDHLKAVECTFDMIDAKNSLLYASDWPHWDFDAPSTIWDIPFLDEQAKRNILGLSAAKLFNLKIPEKKKQLVAR
ncbi:MAG: amidohydrolase family protein [Rhodospirillales bacterium]